MAVITIEIDIDAGGNATATPNPTVVKNGDTVKWHVNSNATNSGYLRVTLPGGANSPFGNAENNGVGVEVPQKCNMLEPNTNPLNWPPGVNAYTYQITFSNSPEKTLHCLILREGTTLVEEPKLALSIIQLLHSGFGFSHLLMMAPPKKPEEGPVKITADDCTSLTFEIPKGAAHPTSYRFNKAGHESWVETIKHSHRNGTSVSVSDSGQLPWNPGGQLKPNDIHDA